jgi:hypothetical protein
MTEERLHDVLGDVAVDELRAEGVPSFRTRRVLRICVAILPGRFECGSFALMVTCRVAILVL